MFDLYHQHFGCDHHVNHVNNTNNVNADPPLVRVSRKAARTKSRDCRKIGDNVVKYAAKYLNESLAHKQNMAMSSSLCCTSPSYSCARVQKVLVPSMSWSVLQPDNFLSVSELQHDIGPCQCSSYDHNKKIWILF